MKIMRAMRRILDILNIDNRKSVDEAEARSSFCETEREELKHAISGLKNALDEFGGEYVSFINKLFSVQSILISSSLVGKDIVEIVIHFDKPEQAVYIADREADLNRRFCSAHELKMLSGNCVSIITIVDGTWEVKRNAPSTNRKGGGADIHKRQFRSMSEYELERFANFRSNDIQEEKFIEKLKSLESKKESKIYITENNIKDEGKLSFYEDEVKRKFSGMEEGYVVKENDVAPICKEQYGDSKPLTLPSVPEKSTADAAKVEARVEVDPSTGEESEEGAFAISADTIFENAGGDQNICLLPETKETGGAQTKKQEIPVLVQENIDSDAEPQSALSEQSIAGNTDPLPVPFIPEKKYEFPPIDLLAKPVQGKGVNERELKEAAAKIQNALRSFGVRVTVTNISCGSAVTQYELQPEQGVKISQIKKLSDDIRLNLAATDIHIEAPIPGKAAIGVEVPNKENTPVILRELLESEEFKKHKSRLAFAVGKNIRGQIVVSDIAKMPHMLISGTTGSGKSVFINNIIMSVLYKSDPKDVKFMMISPNNCGLSIYNGIPHLLIPVVTDPKKASAALNWAAAEMIDRYQKFSELSVRDFNGYNEKVVGFEEPNPAFPLLPQIVIILDDLADLMISSYSMDIEDAISILSGRGGISGIHLVIATQRPSVNIITGRIKANIPSRISFGVFSSIDSMVILDEKGAEKISRVGDMLFKQRGNMNLERIHGAYVSDEEIFTVVDFFRKQVESYTPMEQKEKPEEEKDSCVTDELFFDAG